MDIRGQTRDAIGRSLRAVRGYDHRSYGDGFADVYDEWYADVTDVAATVARMVQIAGPTGRVLELGVGTGRLAVPMTSAGLCVSSASTAAKRCSPSSPHATPIGGVASILGDMVDDLPDGPFDAVLVAYNTIFNVLGDGEQQRLFHRVAERLAPNGVVRRRGVRPRLRGPATSRPR